MASGYHRPEFKNSGSGIYLANGSIAEAYISGTNTSKLIVKDVPIATQRTPANSCVVCFQKA